MTGGQHLSCRGSTPGSGPTGSPPASWPSAAQYNEAIQNLRVTMGDAELQGGEAAVNALGLPMPYAGGFADIYKVRCPATGNTWAVKCFTKGGTGLRQRYAEISRHLDQVQLPFMVDFRYLDQGVRINGTWYPIVKMHWIEGLNLNAFVSRSVDQPAMLDQLFELWVKLAGRLRGAGCAHADLQHGNVLLIQLPGSDKLGLRLIDYDGLYVPALAGQRSGEVGHPSYQHPQRLREGTYSVDVDRFSHLAICCAVRGLRVAGRPLWERFNNGENLLFRETDFAKPAESAVLRELWTLRDPQARALVGHLTLSLQRPLAHAPWLDELVRDGQVRPLADAVQREVQSLLAASPAASVAIPVEVAPFRRQAVAAAVLPPASVEPAAASWVPPTASISRRRVQAARPVDVRRWPGGAAVERVLVIDRWLAKCAGDGNSLLHNSLRVLVLFGLLVGMPWGTVKALRSLERPATVAQAERDPPAGPAVAVSNKLPPTGAPGIGPAVSAAELSGDTFTSSLGLLLKRLPAGEFDRGSNDGESNERPVHRVRISRDFYLGVHEVTQAQYQQVTGKTPSRFRGDDLPVEQVSWSEAVDFCRQLTARDRDQLPQGWSYRLPTEAEWEYAARAGTVTKWSCGDTESELSQYGWYSANSERKTHPVGQKRANPWGLYDMHGNVWEWCWDGYAPYPSTTVEDPGLAFAESSGSARVFGGGSWNFDAARCRAAYRITSVPTNRADDGGFRLALGPSTPVPSALASGTSAKPIDNKAESLAPPAGPPVAVGNKPPPTGAPGKGPAVSAAELSGDTFTSSLGMLLKRIPAGEFDMGSNDGNANEQPVHRVRISRDYYLGIHEVTQSQYQTVTGKNPSQFQGADLPVEQVSWSEAVEFCRQLTSRDRDRLPTDWSYRLPTESEWEYAARAGTATKWSFGDAESELDRYGWYNANSATKTHPVGQKQANPWGLYDMHGNVWEWCGDVYVPYTSTAVENPGLDGADSSGSHRVNRGGSWRIDAAYCRSAYRFTSAPALRSNVLGFRLALSPSVPVSSPSGSGTTAESINGQAESLAPPAGPTVAVGNKPPTTGMPGIKPAASTAELSGDTFKSSIDLLLKRIPAGEFDRGSTDGETSERPVHRVRISRDYYLGIHEVTQSQYQTVTGKNPSRFRGADLPVEQVYWSEAVDFCRQLTSRDRDQLPAGWSYRLPTEAEWEYAARAGTATKWSFGDAESELDRYGWYGANSAKKTHPVGQKQANPWGLYDMHGNVWEWCGDVYAPYPSTAVENPGLDVAESSGSSRVSRGGSWLNVAANCRSASRRTLGPAYRSDFYGFRLALSPSGK